MRGARSRWAGSMYRSQRSTGSRMCPSASMTLYARVIGWPPSLAVPWSTALPAMRHHVSREQRHGLSDQGVFHEPALVEVADELVHAVLPLQGPHPFHAVLGIAEDGHLAIDVLVPDPLHAGQDL